MKNKVAIITGGARGIGRAVAATFVDKGAQVVIVSRTAEEIEQAAKQLTDKHGEAIGIVADVSEWASVEDVVKETLTVFKTVDVLVNCAGVQKPIGPFVHNDIDEWVENIHINLIGTVFCCKAVLPIMIEKRKGKIINFSGGGATSSRPNFSAYACAKTAVVRFTEVLADEVKQYNVQVNAIAPGAVNTRMLDEVLQAGALAGDELADAKRRAQKRGASPELAAELAVWLASDRSDELTGRLISALWDTWRDMDEDEMRAVADTDKYTLRRVT